MADQEELDPEFPPCLHLLSAFLAMEPVDHLLSLARECGEGSLTERMQRFILDRCLANAVGSFHVPYLKKFLKKLITEVESSHGDVLDGLYEQYALYMVSLKDDYLVKGNASVRKCISFLYPDDSFELLPSCPKSRKLVVSLQCSLNMLEGDTGCSLWPSSLFLSELILSFPEIFSKRSCFEVGSGVGLVGLCLAYVKASKIVLSDGDLSTLANMKVNLDLNHLITGTDTPETSSGEPKKVEWIHLPWESASEGELQAFAPDVVLGADVIYDPVCLPHLVRVLASLLNRTTAGHTTVENGNGFDACEGKTCSGVLDRSRSLPVAYISSVIRNIETFHCFLDLIEQANLIITDVTDTLKPLKFLPYLHSYKQTDIRLFVVKCK